MTVARDMETVEEKVGRTRREQGLPRYIEDPVVLRQIVDLLDSVQRNQDADAKDGEAAGGSPHPPVADGLHPKQPDPAEHQPPDTVTYLTVEEVAQRYRTSPATVHSWLYKGTAPRSLKIGRRRLFAVADLVAWENQQAD